MEMEVQKCFCGDSNYGQQVFHGVKEVLGQNRRVGEGSGWMDGWMEGREGTPPFRADQSGVTSGCFGLNENLQ